LAPVDERRLPREIYAKFAARWNSEGFSLLLTENGLDAPPTRPMQLTSD
jgi:hypothetical protein